MAVMGRDQHFSWPRLKSVPYIIVYTVFFKALGMQMCVCFGLLSGT